MKSTFKKILLVQTLLFAFALITKNIAQEISFNTEIYNRYIWRGIDLGNNTPSVQPSIIFSMNNFSAGFWGAYSISDSNGLNEIDLFANYSLDLGKAGSLNFGFTDYMNPNNGVRLSNFNNYDDEEGPGAHSLELNLGYFGAENFPLSVALNYFLHNVSNNPFYFQVGYNFSVKEINLNIFAGGSTGDSGKYYGTENFGIVNIGFKAAKELKISESFSVPISGSIILNPITEEMFYLVGISF